MMYQINACLNFVLHYIFQVKSVDKDEDINSQVEYSIYEKESPGVKDLFGVNRQTGGIYLLKSAVPYGN